MPPKPPSSRDTIWRSDSEVPMKKPAILILVVSACAFAADPTYSDILKAFQYRNFGPWRTGAWVSSLAVPETPAAAHRHTMFAGARTGGVWRTINNGTTW